MSSRSPVPPVATWSGDTSPAFDPAGIEDAIQQVRETAYVVSDPATGRFGIAARGTIDAPPTDGCGASTAFAVSAILPPLYPEWLGDRAFNEVHRTRFAYVSGAMANGIATTRLVIAMAKNGFLGFFGAGGLSYDRVGEAVDELVAVLGHDGLPWGCNLINSPNEPALEAAVAELYLDRGVRRVSAAAYMTLTPAIVRYAYSGVSEDGLGNITRPNMVFAKVSRPEVARRFMNPAPDEMLQRLVGQGQLSVDEARIAAMLPVAEDITVESDSGGHTDNRPLAPLFHSIQAVRDEVQRERNYSRPIRLGAAGGIGTPQAVAAAFALGASYVLTGTINQACIESGLAIDGREMLAAADIADIAMAPAADMFELGVDLQVLKRGTMFAPRAKKLYALYRRYPSLDAIPPEEVKELETRVLGMSIPECWESTRAFWLGRDPDQVIRAEADPRHKMALTFRSYLGLSSRWAIEGHHPRRMDYQIWCGPSIGAFNSWTRDSFLAEPENRSVVQVGLNLMEGAAVVTRAQQLRTYGVPVPPSAFRYGPRLLQATAVDIPSPRFAEAGAP